MSKPTYTQAELTLLQSNIRTAKAVIGILFWIAVGAVPAWHFSAEHERLSMLEQNANVQVIAMSDLGKSVPVPNHVMNNIIANAAKGSN